MFFNRCFLSISFSVCFSPIHNTTASYLYYTQRPYLCFVSSFHLLYAVHQYLPSRMPVRKTTPDKTHNIFQWHMFQIHVALQPLGTVDYLPLLLVTSLSRNYYGGRGRRPARSL